MLFSHVVSSDYHFFTNTLTAASQLKQSQYNKLQMDLKCYWKTFNMINLAEIYKNLQDQARPEDCIGPNQGRLVANIHTLLSQNNYLCFIVT